ncbi:polysaccharide biosynthesis tyrosine autokinase [Aquihabitans sp. McL0605]|uniref:polysaccharide biosynthesis tyrosine autokinase n=1 Tax=Aquihabitans sp. McL0605 TaxID=3415671 RepID=UPI003CF60573
MQPTQDSTEVSFTQYLEVLRRRWLWIVLTPAVLVGFTLFTDLRAQPVYSASSQILLQSKPSENILTGSVQDQDPARALQNELRVIRSRKVQLAVQEKFGSPISVSAVAGGEDDVIIVSATSSDPDDAAKRVNTYVETYQTARLDTLLDDLTSTKKIIQQQIDDFQSQVDKINEPLAALDAQIATIATTDPRYDSLVADRERLKERTDAQRTDAQNQLADYQQRLQILQLSERLTTTGGVQVLNPASPPHTPISPTIARDVLQSLIIGLFLGVALAFARDQLDDSIRSKIDLERSTKDLPTLALIPDDAMSLDSSSKGLVTVDAPMSAGAEAYRGLRTAIQYAQLEAPMQIIQITSANSGEGKTTTISNLAVAFAQAGNRVIVVGCDLRRPRLHQTMKVEGSVGLTSVVLGYQTLDEAIQTSPRHPNVDVLCSGPLPPNPSELLNHQRTGNILRLLAEQYAVVFIDCPPVLPVTDSLVLSRNVDATIFLARSNVTTRRASRRAIEMLRQVDSPLVGSVLTGVAGEDTYGSFYEYYGYTPHSTFPVIGRFFGRKSYDPPRIDTDQLPPEPKDESASSMPRA